MIGKSLSHYRISAELGRGGMGIVYRATDTKLDRIVAIKVLPAAALASEEDRARFYREAKAAAQLHHPNIASVFEIDEAVPEGGDTDEPRPFIAMEFIGGEPLNERIKKGPLKLEEAVRIASQIASALEAAHEKDIVHRDIKSANVMLTKKGDAKVLDFGLAKTTQSTMLTRMGSTLGTVAYMSPEQARGEEVDHRTDLWALGVTLYEMIAGRHPFGGDYDQAVTYSILNEDPEPLTSVRTGVPMGLEWIVTKLLAKSADDRYQNATDLLVDLRTVDLSATGMLRHASVSEMQAAQARMDRNEGRAKGTVSQASLWAAGGAMIVALVWFLWPVAGNGVSPISTKRLSQEIPLTGTLIAVDISPDGSKVAYSSDFLRILDLKTGLVREIPEAGASIHVEFSPDSEWILLTGATSISRVSVEGGTVIRIQATEEGGPRALWASNDVILFEELQSIYRKSLSTGETVRVTTPDSLAGEYDHDWPSLLPDGKTIVATAEIRDAPSRIGFWDLETGENKGYLDYPGYRVQWVPTGHLLFEMNTTAVALPFDPKTLSQTGPLIPVMSDTRAEGLSVSDDGTLVHAGSAIGVLAEAQPVIPASIELPGLMTELGFPPDFYRDLVISPDAEQAAVVIQNGPESTSGQDIWVLDFELGSRRQITQGGNNDYPTWMPDGDSLLYVRTQFATDAFIMIQAVDGTGGARIFWDPITPGIADLDVSEDGTRLTFVEGPPAGFDVQTYGVILDIGNKRNLFYWFFDTGNPRRPSFSPDGGYIAYEDAGAILVVSAEQETSVPVTVWSESMSLPRWSRDGSKLFALAADGVPHFVNVRTTPQFDVTSSPQVFINWVVAGVRLFDVFPGSQKVILPIVENSPSGQVVARPAEDRTLLHFIINWFGELEQSTRFK